jgi:hypothetical protein
MTDADTNLSNLTTLWLLLGAVLVFLMQVAMISSSSRIIRLFFPYKLASLGRYFKKVLRNDAIEASF